VRRTQCPSFRPPGISRTDRTARCNREWKCRVPAAFRGYGEQRRTARNRLLVEEAVSCEPLSTSRPLFSLFTGTLQGRTNYWGQIDQFDWLVNRRKLPLSEPNSLRAEQGIPRTGAANVDVCSRE
jgi:hypothetical protein